MDKISKEHADKLSAIRNRLDEADKAISALENAMDEAVDKLNEAIVTYNELLKEADVLATEVVDNIESHMSIQNDKWDEENGETYRDWRDRWADTYLNPLDEVDSPGVDEHEHATWLADLPHTP